MPSLADDIRRTCEAIDVEVHITTLFGPAGHPFPPTADPIAFDYINALKPFPPHDFSKVRPMNRMIAEGTSVLVLDMIEGEATVRGTRVVCEVDGSWRLGQFRGDGSNAAELAIVVKSTALKRIVPGASLEDAARRLARAEAADLVVIRSELGGATLLKGDLPPRHFPALEAARWFRLGAGNVFCAVFAYCWAEHRLSAPLAVELACQAVGDFNEGMETIPVGRLLRVQDGAAQRAVPMLPDDTKPLIRLEASATNYEDRRLAIDVYDGLMTLGAEVQRKRGFEAVLPARVLNVLGQPGAGGFGLTLWIALTTTRRALGIAGLRF